MDRKVIEVIVGKCIDQGGDPVAALMLRYALVHAPPPLDVEYILAHRDVTLLADRETQELRAVDAAGNELCTAALDVDERSHLLRHVIERHEAAGGREAYALADWALGGDNNALAPLGALQGIAQGLIDVKVSPTGILVRPTAAGRRLAEGLTRDRATR